jgi:hypothetical protein
VNPSGARRRAQIRPARGCPRQYMSVRCSPPMAESAIRCAAPVVLSAAVSPIVVYVGVQL